MPFTVRHRCLIFVDSRFDLPPTSIAKPLSAFHKAALGDESKQKTGRKRASKDGNSHQKVHDDTPRAFARLLNFQKTGKQPAHTLDDGSAQKGKKRKRGVDDQSNRAADAEGAPMPAPETAAAGPSEIKILPGERLAEFSARVDHALPIAGLRSRGRVSNTKIPGLKAGDRKTKHNRRLERMQQQWREEETRRKQKLEEEMADKEEEWEEQQFLWAGAVTGEGVKKKKRKGAKGAAADGDDPWTELEERRRETRQKNLQDVVQAPPQLKGVKTRFRVYGLAGVDVGNVPGRVGSLRKREELGSIRREVIDEYRKMMGRKNPAINV